MNGGNGIEGEVRGSILERRIPFFSFTRALNSYESYHFPPSLILNHQRQREKKNFTFQNGSTPLISRCKYTLILAFKFPASN